jgi:hypothetical protein
VIATGMLAYRLYSSPEGCQRYRETLRRVIKEAWQEEVLLKEVDRLQKLLAPAPADPSNAAIENVRQFIKNRRSEIEPELAGPPPQLNSKPLEMARRRKIGHFEASFAAPWGKLNQAVLVGPGAGSLSGILYGKPIHFSKVGTQAGSLGNPAAEARPGIIIGGMEAEGGRGFVLYLLIDPELYASGVTLPVNNTHVYGGFLEMNDKGQVSKMLGMARGSLRLRTASQEPNAPVEGEVAIDVFSKLPEAK